MNDPLQHIQMALAQLASIAVVIACLILWLRRRSGWALLALIGELGSLACSLAFSLAPQAFAGERYFLLLWPLNACIFAGGLLGYAWFDTTPRGEAAPGPSGT